MILLAWMAAAGLAAAPQEVPAGEVQPLREGVWRAWLDSPGGELPFELELRTAGPELAATIHNGPERIPFGVSRWDGATLTLGMPHYDSTITATLGEGGQLEGEWTKRGTGASWTRMAFTARYCAEAPGQASFCRFGARAGALQSPVDGRWRVAFESDDQPAVAVFEQDRMRLRGTFLTTLGDYRFLAGDVLDGALQLSCFDGAHAFLFKARMRADGSLGGDFWSRDSWHETWTAVRDPDASLPDAFELTRWNEQVPLASLAYPDLDGVERSLGDAAYAGKARILKLFGTWCPNCNDEAGYLAELDRRYRERGLSIVGLAFEHTGELERDARQVRRYVELHGIEFPILLAGTSDKADASERFPLVDRVRAYPTTIFIDSTGRVRAIHTGFSGPATGDEHRKLREDFERMIETLLAEADGRDG